MALSKRLKLIADLVTPGNRVADIGTDHGYVPIYLIKNSVSPKAIAADISKGSLEKAKKNIIVSGLASQIECRLSDGLDAIRPKEAETIIIAGMGGILIDRILRDGIEVVKEADELILGPQRNVELIHYFAEEFNYKIEYDNTVLDKGKYYNILKLSNCKK